MRGEKLDLTLFNKDGAGSPPRARGKVEATEGIDFNAGITPACAGKSSTHRGHPGPDRDHPRVRGEKDP